MKSFFCLKMDKRVDGEALFAGFPCCCCGVNEGMPSGTGA